LTERTLNRGGGVFWGGGKLRLLQMLSPRGEHDGIQGTGISGREERAVALNRTGERTFNLGFQKRRSRTGNGRRVNNADKSEKKSFRGETW